jgi:UDP-apiose/xylose synthase
MNIALLGVGGFIGSNLVEFLIEADEHDIVGVDATDEKLAGISGPRFSFTKADIRSERELLEDVVAGADVVVDLIAYANPSIYVTRPLEVIDLNFFENYHIVELCVKHHKRLIQYSTSEVYGHPSGEVYDEDTSELRLGPIQKQRWVYAAAKQLLERVVHGHGLRGDLDYTIVRPFNFVGPRFDYLVDAGAMGGPRLFAHFMSALLRGGPMYLVDGGHRHRSFTHIGDANTAFQTMLDHPGARNEIFNVGNPAVNVTVRQVAELMCELYTELTGEAPACELVDVDGETFYGEGYEDVDRVIPNVAKLRALGWEPRHDLRETFRDAMASYLDEG